MAHAPINRCKENTSTTGTGNLTLTGAVTGFASVASKLTSNGDTSWFCAEAGSQWEIFLGTRVSATELARTTLLSSSTGSTINFSTPPVVFSTVPAERILALAFSAYRSSSNQSVTNGVYTKVQLNAENFDTANAFDSTTNYRFTAPFPGIYRFDFAVSCSGTSATTVVAALYKNGSKILVGSEGAAVSSFSEGVSTGSALIQLAASDYIELFVYIGATSPVARTTDTFLSGSLVVPLA